MGRASWAGPTYAVIVLVFPPSVERKAESGGRREEKGREGKRREGKGREGKGREGKGKGGWLTSCHHYDMFGDIT